LTFDSLHNEIKNKLKQLNNPDIFSRKFYNKGRVFTQKLDCDYNIIEPNIQLSQKLNYDMSKVLQLNFLDLIPKNEWPYFKNATLITKRTKETIVVNTEIYGVKGNPYNARCALKSAGAEGYELYIEFVENEHSESELLGLSKSYTEAFYKSPVGMILINQDFRIAKCNNSSEAIIGKNASELLGYNLLRILPSNTKELTRLFNGASKHGFNEKIITCTNAVDQIIITQWVVNTVEQSQNQKNRYICIIQDITERVMFEKEKNKVYKALDQSKSAIIMTDNHGKIEYVNETFLKLSEYSREEVLDQNMNVLSSGEQSNDVYRNLWSTITNGDIWNGEFRNVKKTGDHYWCKESIYPIKEQDEIIGFMGIQQDVTGEKELQDLNMELRNRLFDQDKIASLGMLTSGIIHEINNPLSYIQMNLNYLDSQMKSIQFDDKEQHLEIGEALEDIMEGVNQIKDIATGLKKYVYKTDDEVKDTINVVESIGEILILTKNEYKYHVNVHFEYNKEETYYICGYASKFKQVMMNLIINATHAIIAKNLDELGNINIIIQQNHDEVIISLQDDGIGINQEVIDKIFDPLFTTKEQGVGTGLGLSISKQIIEEEHGGQILCTSTEGEGTSFTIKLAMGCLL